MRFPTRIAILLGILATVACAQAAVRAHMAASTLPEVRLGHKLAEFPDQIDDWSGRDTPVSDPSFLYADDHLHRVYGLPQTGQNLVLWMAYSTHAVDRQNNPEVCMTSHGHVEDVASRQLVRVAGRGEPIQVYRFIHPTSGSSEWVFYWHYTLAPLEKLRELTPLQRRYHLSRHQFSSVSIEVFVPQRSDADLPGAISFVTAVDEQLRQFLPSEAVRGSARLPIKPVGDDVIHRRTNAAPSR